MFKISKLIINDLEFLFRMIPENFFDYLIWTMNFFKTISQLEKNISAVKNHDVINIVRKFRVVNDTTGWRI